MVRYCSDNSRFRSKEKKIAKFINYEKKRITK